MEDILKPIEIVKRGETSLAVTLVRSGGGLTIYVKAHPAVENFMRNLGTGETVDVKASGPFWRPLLKDDPPLLIYQFSENVPNITLDDGSFGTICRPGQQLLESAAHVTGRSSTHMVNLSFLRLVGISEGAGKSFTVRGVHSLDAVIRMKESLGEAYKRFYRMYMKPVKMDIVCSTQETAL